MGDRGGRHDNAGRGRHGSAGHGACIYPIRSALREGGSYRWRVHAELAGFVDPWSAWATFIFDSGRAEIFTAADGTRFRVDVVAMGLEVPLGLAFASDGRLFVTERPGGVRIIENGVLLPEPALTLYDVYAQIEAGALGLAVHPQFEQNRYVYLVYTPNARDRARSTGWSAIESSPTR